jgi:hypothetical protein
MLFPWSPNAKLITVIRVSKNCKSRLSWIVTPLVRTQPDVLEVHNVSIFRVELQALHPKDPTLFTFTVNRISNPTYSQLVIIHLEDGNK